MLFGSFTIADAFYAPVVMRIRTYALPVAADVAAWMGRVVETASVSAWMTDAVAEKEWVDFDEPYRERSGGLKPGVAR
jgi:glutathione S-transferase